MILQSLRLLINDPDVHTLTRVFFCRVLHLLIRQSSNQLVQRTPVQANEAIESMALIAIQGLLTLTSN
jgi:hypothetical protein